MSAPKSVTVMRMNALIIPQDMEDIIAELSEETREKLLNAAKVVENNWQRKADAIPRESTQGPIRGFGEKSALELILCLMAKGYI